MSPWPRSLPACVTRVTREVLLYSAAGACTPARYSSTCSTVRFTSPRGGRGTKLYYKLNRTQLRARRHISTASRSTMRYLPSSSTSLTWARRFRFPPCRCDERAPGRGVRAWGACRATPAQSLRETSLAVETGLRLRHAALPWGECARAGWRARRSTRPPVAPWPARSSRPSDALCDEAAGVRKAGWEMSVRCVGEI